MSHSPRAHTLYTHSACWIFRGIGLLVNSFFLWILYLTLTSENGIPPQSWPVIVCLALCILGVFIALRWEQIGGRLAMAGAGPLMLAVLYAAFTLNLGWQGWVLALAYPVPFFLVGSLFLTDSPTQPESSLPADSAQDTQ